jgi:hypothetical protein
LVCARKVENDSKLHTEDADALFSELAADSDENDNLETLSNDRQVSRNSEDARK